MTDTRHTFPSWYSFVDQVRDTSRITWTQRNQSSQEVGGHDGWYGTRTFAEAIDMALGRGWPEGRKMMTEFLSLVTPRPEAFRSIIYDVAGAIPLVPLFVSGDPACMMDWQNEVVAANPVVRLDYCNGGLASIGPKAMMLRGAAVLSLAASLEQRGYSTEIRVVVHTDGKSYLSGRHKFITETTVKRAGENIDLDRLAFALAHPAVHRRLRFALMEQDKSLEPIFGSGHGSTQQTAFVDPAPNVIFIPGPSGSETPESAKLAVQVAAASFIRGDLRMSA